MEKTANRIKSFRKNYSLTQVELADALGVSFATVNRWENNQRKPSSLALAKLNELEAVLGKQSIKLTEEELSNIISIYSSALHIKSNTIKSEGPEPLWARLERAASNQIYDGAATVSRYAIWANTVRDNIGEAIKFIEDGNISKAVDILIRAANSLSAFSEIQSHFDTLLNYHK